jgi:hypothetical protein
MKKENSMNADPDPLEDFKKVLESPCHSKEIPLWLVLLDNVPTLVLFVLGAILIGQISVAAAIAFFGYALFSVVYFWARICPFCHHYNTLACPCGYGIISGKLFKRRTDKSFKKVFKNNLGIVFPNWFIPLAVAVYLLITRYSTWVLILTIAFCLIGFVLIPLISKLVGCKNCEIKDDCPWMKGNSNK